MPVKSLLVYLDDTSNCRIRADMAAALADRDTGRLSGIYIMTENPGAVSSNSRVGQHVPAEIRENQQKMMEQRAERAAEQLRHAAKRFSVAGGAEVDRVGSSSPSHVLAERAKYADLVVLGKSSSDEPGSTDLRLPQRVLLLSGCPVLVVPSSVETPQPPNRIAIAWNDSREAGRAVRDAMPLLTAAEEVTVLTTELKSSAEAGVSRLLGYLRAHGVEAVHQHVTTGSLKVADALLSRTSEHAADLIVMGGYGRSRVKEVLTGGTTRKVLESTTVPVFVSH